MNLAAFAQARVSGNADFAIIGAVPYAQLKRLGLGRVGMNWHWQYIDFFALWKTRLLQPVQELLYAKIY